MPPIFADILLPLGAVRLYKRKAITLFEMVILFVVTTMLIFGCLYFSSVKENIDKIFMQFSLFVMSAGSLDFLVKSNKKNELKKSSVRMMYSVFGFLLTIALFRSNGFRRDNSPVKYTWIDLSEIATWMGNVLFFLSLIYFSIRIFTELKNMIKTSTKI